MQCKLYKTIDFPAHDLFIGEIIETYFDEKVLTNNAVDLSKVKPILFDMSESTGSWENPLPNTGISEGD